MTNEELRKLNRKDLLKLLVRQGRECDSLRARLEEAEAALEDRRIRIEKSGSLAEAALQINGVFEAAQAAAQQYLENIRIRAEGQCSSEDWQAEVSGTTGPQGGGGSVISGNREDYN